MATGVNLEAQSMGTSLTPGAMGTCHCWFLLGWAWCWSQWQNPVLTSFFFPYTGGFCLHVVLPGVGGESNVKLFFLHPSMHLLLFLCYLQVL